MDGCPSIPVSCNGRDSKEQNPNTSPCFFSSNRHSGTLNLNLNYISGSIPTEIGLLSNLSKSKNHRRGLNFRGCHPGRYYDTHNHMPSCYTNSILEALDLTGNELTGSIPSSIANCRQLGTFCFEPDDDDDNVRPLITTIKIIVVIVAAIATGTAPATVAVLAIMLLDRALMRLTSSASSSSLSLCPCVWLMIQVYLAYRKTTM